MISIAVCSMCYWLTGMSVGNVPSGTNIEMNDTSATTYADVVRGHKTKIVKVEKEDERRSCEDSSLNSSQLQLNPIVAN